MGKLPAIMLYDGDWLKDDVAGCSLAAQGLTLRMMFIGHNSERYGYLQQNGKPIPPESIARRCGCTPEQYLSLLSELESASVWSRTPDEILFKRRMVRDAAARDKERDKKRKQRCPASVPPLSLGTVNESESEIEVHDLRKEKAIIGFELENFDADVHFEHLCRAYKKAERGYGAQTAFCEAIEYVVQHHKLTRTIAAGYIISKAEKYCELEQFQKGMTNWLRDKIFEQDESVWQRKENGIPKPNGKKSLEELYPDA